MLALEHAKARIDAVLAEIARLSDSDFPHSHSKKGLDEIGQTVLLRKTILEGLTTTNQRDVILAACSEALVHIFVIHPLLGFILRSTNLRNSFEIYRPILNLSKLILGPDTNLILSSEWDYSPFVFPPNADLPNFVLMGLPASESGNPLLVPLAGHELGHSTWRGSRGLGSKYSPKLMDGIYTNIESRWPEFAAILPCSRADLRSDVIIATRLSPYHLWSIRQAEETFCDFMGIRIFADSYFFAFSYLVSPGGANERPVHYPKTITRVNNMVQAAQRFGLSVPTDYAQNFLDDLDSSDAVHNLLMSAVDNAVRTLTDELAVEADGIVRASGVPERSAASIQAGYEAFKSLVPVDGVGFLGDIINAGWVAYNDADLWAGQEEVRRAGRSILFDLVLKSIEIHEIETITGPTP